MTKISLNDAERAMIRRQETKTGYIARVEFSGPRGRRYIPIRGALRVTSRGAERDVHNITARQYKHGAYSTGAQILEVDALGNVKTTATL